MERALALAARGWGRTSPNPMVGAVVCRGSTIVGEGYHERYGGPHAEVHALRAAGERAVGATLYVTLEPCAHRGKTPPCVDAILAAGIRRVVYAVDDPHPQGGGGAHRLREAGVEVERGLLAAPATRLNAAFLWRNRTGRPFVALKLALSLDGRIAAEPGRPTRLTGAAAEREVHRLRAGHDAIVIGRRTAEADDPRLTVRIGPEPRRPPVRVVLDTEARLGLDGELVGGAERVPTWLVCAPGAGEDRRRALAARGVRVLEAERSTAGGGLAPAAVLDRLAEEGVGAVLLEGGGRVAASFLQAGAVQRMYLFFAPRLLGEDGVPGFPLPRGTESGWAVAQCRRLGGDALIELENAEALELLRGGT